MSSETALVAARAGAASITAATTAPRIENTRFPSSFLPDCMNSTFVLISVSFLQCNFSHDLNRHFPDDLRPVIIVDHSVGRALIMGETPFELRLSKRQTDASETLAPRSWGKRCEGRVHRSSCEHGTIGPRRFEIGISE